MTSFENNFANTPGDLLRQQIENRTTPGLYYAFFDTEKVLFEYSGGKADLKTGAPVEPSTAFHAFSVTKTFTAIAVMQLAEQGKLRLDDPVKTYWPEFPYGSGISVRQLLAHSGGLSNPLPISWIHRAEDDPAFDEQSFFHDIFRRHPKTKSGPNEKFAYSNLDHIALGRVIQRVSGLPYRQYVEQHILKPLKLEEDLGFVRNSRWNMATGYQKAFSFGNLLFGFFLDKKRFMGEKTDGWKSFLPFYVNGSAYGGLLGKPGAFITFIQDLLRPDSRLLSPESRREMFTENRLNDGRATGMSLSWYAGNLQGHPYYCHAGGGGGYYCEIRIYPASGLGSVLFTNRSGFTDERLLDKTDAAFIR